MKMRTIGRLALFGSLIVSLSGCAATLECGSWVFTGTPAYAASQSAVATVSVAEAMRETTRMITFILSSR